MSAATTRWDQATLTCTHFALVTSALKVHDRVRCEVCNEQRTIVAIQRSELSANLSEARRLRRSITLLARRDGLRPTF